MRALYTLTLITLIALLTGCSGQPEKGAPPAGPGAATPPEPPKPRYTTLEERLITAEGAASPAGRRILATGRFMALEARKILPGGCWDYIHEIYNQAGYPHAKRKTVIASSKDKGPYAEINAIQPGDWLYYINHSYGGSEHSAIFVAWLDKTNKTGLMLSYGGERRRQPARYLSYDLSSVYQIVRPVEQ